MNLFLFTWSCTLIWWWFCLPPPLLFLLHPLLHPQPLKVEEVLEEKVSFALVGGKGPKTLNSAKEQRVSMPESWVSDNWLYPSRLLLGTSDVDVESCYHLVGDVEALMRLVQFCWNVWYDNRVRLDFCQPVGRVYLCKTFPDLNDYVYFEWEFLGWLNNSMELPNRFLHEQEGRVEDGSNGRSRGVPNYGFLRS